MKATTISVFKALGHKRRVQILKKISFRHQKKEKATLVFLSNELGIPRESTRFHLEELIKAKLIKKEKRKGGYVYISFERHLILDAKIALGEFLQ
ncbi:MAG: hypothetical protein B6I23_00265 [Rickettsiaceae bacterium 4572_127]|nr:MAG: hypothetical protein B6I23_00265 [Rickettsiaceae bacterium 4572_127]